MISSSRARHIDENESNLGFYKNGNLRFINVGLALDWKGKRKELRL
jgi:hypothetical protein